MMKSLVSLNNGTKSHNAGLNCMECHKTGGAGEGIFTMAGTVYNSAMTTPLPNGVVKLYSGQGGTGTLLQTVEVDGKGNFFTTKAIDFGTGIYVAVQGSTVTKYMGPAITTGQCSSCHGVSVGKVWTE